MSTKTMEFARQSFLGVYESEDENGWVFVLHEDGGFQTFANDLEVGGGRWKIVGEEVHLNSGWGQWDVYTLNDDNNLVNIANISDRVRDKGTREDYPEKDKSVFKKIKTQSTSKPPIPKEVDILGTYAQKSDNEESFDKTRRLIFLKNGVAKSLNGDEIVKWKIKGSEIRTIYSDEWSGNIYKKEQNGDLSEIGFYQGTHIIPYTIKERTTWVKIK